MPDEHDLLARLNALKPSTVSLNTSPAIDIEIQHPESREDKLSDRLRRLRHGETKARPAAAAAAATQSQNASSVVSTNLFSTTHLQPQDWQQDAGDLSVDDLLAELGSNEQARLDPNDPDDIHRLMEEAKELLDSQPQPLQHDSIEEEARPNNRDEEHLNDKEEKEEEQDQQQADEYVSKVLAELEFEKKHGIIEASPPEQHFPATPSDLRVINPPSYEDSELEARFSKLAMGLPSAPSSLPTSKQKTKSANTTKPKSKLPTYTDEDIDSWCGICNEDGELRCIGCDGDIYCTACWKESHGTGPGQERGHKAVLYSKKDVDRLEVVD